MVSVDASDKMLKYALKSRWDRRKEPAFDQWGGQRFSLFRVSQSRADCQILSGVVS